MSRERISLSLQASAGPVARVRLHRRGRPAGHGRVTKLVEFGAFVQVGDGIEGLVHISEMSTPHVDSPTRSSRRRGAVGEDHRPRPRPPADQPVDQAGRRGWRAGQEYREHFEVDERATGAGDTDAEREAAWSEYHGDEAGECRRRRREAMSTEASPPNRRLLNRCRRGRHRRARPSPPSQAETVPAGDARRPHRRHRLRQVGRLAVPAGAAR